MDELDAELLAQLSRGGLSVGFAGLDLAAGKLPQPAVALVSCAADRRVTRRCGGRRRQRREWERGHPRAALGMFALCFAPHVHAGEKGVDSCFRRPPDTLAPDDDRT